MRIRKDKPEVSSISMVIMTFKTFQTDSNVIYVSWDRIVTIFTMHNIIITELNTEPGNTKRIRTIDRAF